MIIAKGELTALDRLMESVAEGRYDHGAGLAQKAVLAFLLNHPHLLLATHFDQFRDYGIADYVRFLWSSDLDHHVRNLPRIKDRGLHLIDEVEVAMRNVLFDQSSGSIEPVLAFRETSGAWLRLVHLDLFDAEGIEMGLRNQMGFVRQSGLRQYLKDKGQLA